MAGYRAVSMNVRRIPLGSTGLRVSEMIFGGAPIGGLYAPVSDDQAAAALEAAWAAGIRAFDTAPHYGAGLSEQRLGRFLGGRPRDEFVLSTKVGRRLVPETGDVEGTIGTLAPVMSGPAMSDWIWPRVHRALPIAVDHPETRSRRSGGRAQLVRAMAR